MANCSVFFKRHLAKTLSRRLLLLVLCTGITIAVALIKLSSIKQNALSETSQRLINRNLWPKDSVPRQNLFQSIAKSRDKIKNMGTKKWECPIRDFFASVDATAKVYDPDLLCDEFAAKSDIVCRMHLRQIGLEHLEKSTCALQDPEKVPRVVYFVIFGTYVFRFLHYIAVLAAKRYVSPSAIYVIGDRHPTGIWWRHVLRDIHGVRFLYRELPTNISGQPVDFIHHLSDIVRLQTVYMNGGIYLDADMVVVRDLTPLLDYSITLGLIENATGMGNAFIAAKRGSSFIRDWYTQYTHYNKNKIYRNSLQVPRELWLQNSSRVHMESQRLYRPNWFEVHLLYNRTDYPWRDSYAVHIWTNHNQNLVPQSPDDIQTSNTTVAQIFRHVLYGDSRPRIKA